MGTLYIDRKDLHVRLDGNAIAFYAGGKREGIVPINPLRRVFVVGNVSIETPVLHRLAGENVGVVFLSGKRLGFRGMLHGKLHNNGLLRVRQYEKSLSDRFRIETARDLVIRKLSKQSEFLLEARDRRPDLRLKLTDCVAVLKGAQESLRETGGLESIRGFEGGAAASYFSVFTTMFAGSLGFERRTRRPPEDPVNAMLSLCYTFLHFEMVREIESIGLDPTIGFYHDFDYGRESLACDLVEPYRPDADRFVWDLFRVREFSSRDFAEGDERPGCYLKKGSRRKFYPLYEEWAKERRTGWVEEVRMLARRIADGQDIIPE